MIWYGEICMLNKRIRELANASGFNESEGFTFDDKLNEFARLIIRDALIEIDSAYMEMRLKGWEEEAAGVELSTDTLMDHFNVKFATTSNEFITWEDEHEIN